LEGLEVWIQGKRRQCAAHPNNVYHHMWCTAGHVGPSVGKILNVRKGLRDRQEFQ
jgi:hypothetical protein